MSKFVLGSIYALICVILWGLTFIFSRVLLDAGASPFEIMLSRFCIAWLCLCCVKPKGLAFKGIKHELPYIAAGIFGGSLYFFLENTALIYTKASNVGIICELAPIFTALLFWAVYRQRPQLSFFIGSLIAFFGVVLVSTEGNFSEFSPSLLGDSLAILAILSWAIYSLSIREIRLGKHDESNELTIEKTFDSIAVTKRIFFWCIVTGLCVLPFIQVDFNWLIKGSGIIWANLLFLALGGSALSYVLWNDAMQKLGEVRSSLFIYLIPVVTVIASFFVLGESLSVAAIVGIVAVTGGLLISSKGSF